MRPPIFVALSSVLLLIHPIAADNYPPPPDVPKGRTGSWLCNAGLPSGAEGPAYRYGCVYALKPTQQDVDRYHAAQARYRQQCQEGAERRTVTLAGHKWGHMQQRAQQKCALKTNKCCDGRDADQGYLTATFEGLRAGDSIWFHRKKGCSDQELVHIMPYLPRFHKENGMPITRANEGSQSLRAMLPRDRGMSAQIRRIGDSDVRWGDCPGNPPVFRGGWTPGSHVN